MTKSSMNASSLKYIMITMIFVIIIGALAGFYFAQDWLRQYTLETSQIDTQTNSEGTQALSQIKESVENNKSDNNLALSLFLTEENYQKRTLDDLTKYASATGISINSNSWSQQPDTGVPVAGGVKSKFITISLETPVSMNSLLQFIKGIETNIPKMQISSISISSPDSDQTGMVSVEPILIEVYTK